MVDLVGRLDSVHRADAPSAAAHRDAHRALHLCHDGAVAGLDSSPDHWTGNISLPSKGESSVLRHLTGLLGPLHSDPEQLAARLLYRFGSIGRISQAPGSELRQAAQADERWVDALIMVRQLLHDGMREHFVRTRLGADRQALVSYLLMTMRHLSDERLMAFFADSEGFVIAEEIIAEGSDAHVLLTPRRIFSRALKLDARIIVLAHNHPSGCASPSPLDIDSTRRLAEQATSLGLTIDDHFVVGARAVTSMKDRGLI